MTLVELGLILLGFAAIVVGVRAFLRNRSKDPELDEPETASQEEVSYATGRDEVTWRRAYSRM